MKHAIAIVAAGVLSASVSVVYAQPLSSGDMREMQGSGTTVLRPGELRLQSGQVRPSLAIAGQTGGVALPKLPANLQDPAAAGQATTDIYAFMALFQRMAQQMRDQARQERNAALDAQVQALQAAAAKMQQAALAAMQQAMINGQMQAAAGAVQIGQSAQGQTKPTLQAKLQGVPPGQPGPAVQLTPQQKQQALGASTNAQQVFAATLAAAQADAKKAEVQAAVGANAQQNQVAQQQMQQMMDVIRDIRDKLQAIQQSQVEVNRGIARNF